MIRVRVPEAVPAARVNVTPLIDVMMVLIIFYLLVGKLSEDRRAAVQLPLSPAGVEREAGGDPIIVSLPAPGVVLVNGVDARSRGAAALVLETTGGEAAKVELRAAGGLDASEVTAVLESLRRVGVRAVSVAAEQE